MQLAYHLQLLQPKQHELLQHLREHSMATRVRRLALLLSHIHHTSMKGLGGLQLLCSAVDHVQDIHSK
jgi:hypothetical protein